MFLFHPQQFFQKHVHFQVSLKIENVDEGKLLDLGGGLLLQSLLEDKAEF